jgi:hypothetical protein
MRLTAGDAAAKGWLKVGTIGLGQLLIRRRITVDHRLSAQTFQLDAIDYQPVRFPIPTP